MPNIKNKTNRRILVIDDNEAIHADYRAVLTGTDAHPINMDEEEAALFGAALNSPKQAYFELDSAFQGREGLDKVQQSLQAGRPYAMAFVDIRMPPGWDGTETIQRIWQVDPQLQVVICTAYSDNSPHEIIQKLGKTDQMLILKKPFDNVEVYQLACALTEKWVLSRKAELKQQELEGWVKERTAELAAANDLVRQEIIERKQAMEVQQNLLPKKNLKFAGLEIAGKSIYCQETGGDYYDFILSGEPEDKRIGIAIGDVAGHGIPSALLMATVRASLRQRISQPGGIAQIITDVNHQLARDVEGSGRFMTLFYLVIDCNARVIDWVRAGHEPAILYDPETDTFENLYGPGVALGVDEGWQFEESRKRDIKKGQIVLLGTDGIWETRNARGKMFGKAPIYKIIRKNSALATDEILSTIINSLDKFRQGAKIEDDITLVLIKFEK